MEVESVVGYERHVNATADGPAVGQHPILVGRLLGANTGEKRQVETQQSAFSDVRTRVRGSGETHSEIRSLRKLEV